GAGVAGTWALSVQIEGMPDAIPVQLVLTEEEDGTITGVSTAMDFDTPILDAQYNKNTGELTYRMETPGGMTEVLAQIDGDHFSGTFTVAEMQGSFSGSRIIEGEQEEADTF